MNQPWRIVPQVGYQFYTMFDCENKVICVFGKDNLEYFQYILYCVNRVRDLKK